MKTTEQDTATHGDSISLTGSINAQSVPRKLERLIIALIIALGIALGIALVTSTAALHGQGWETVDEILRPAAVSGIVADGAGNVFANGSTTDASGTAHAVVMKSSDQGGTWVTVDDVASAKNSPILVRSLASVRIATGASNFEDRLVTASWTDEKQWLTRMSVDAGETWTTLDLYTHPNPDFSLNVYPSVGLDAAGNIYLSGYAAETVVTGSGRKATTTTVTHPLIRKFESGAWTTIESGVGNRIVCGGSDLFQVGSAPGGWSVRKSTDAGETWTTVDTFLYDASGATSAYDIAADNFGNVAVVGRAIRTVTTGKGKNATTVTHQYWIARVGTAGGTAWMAPDIFELGIRPSGFPAVNAAFGVTIDNGGNVHVTGYGCGSNNVRRWITRTRSNTTGLWSTTDDFTHTAGTVTEGRGIAADLSGNLYSTGVGSASNWLVRRNLAP